MVTASSKLLPLLLCALSGFAATPDFVVPPEAFYHSGRGGGILDVTKPPFNAKGDGVHDDTAALTAAMRFVRDNQEVSTATNGNVFCFQRRNRHWTIYLPNGTYRVSDSINQGWPALALNNQYGWDHIRYELVQNPAEEAYLATRFDGVTGKPYLHGEPSIAALDTANGSFLKGQYMETSIYDEANWAIRVRGESRDGVRIRLDDGAKGFGVGARKPVFAFYLLQRGSNVNLGNFLENVTIDTGRKNPGAVALAWNSSNFGAVRNVRLVGEGIVGLEMPVNNACGHIRDLEIDGFRTGVVLQAGRESIVTLERAAIRNADLGFLVGGADSGGGADVLNLWKVSLDRVKRPYELRRAGVLNALDCSFDVGTPRPRLAPQEQPRAEYAFADIVTPEAFGAVGDGIHDDTEAIRKALSSGHARVVFTRSIYRFDGTVTIPPSVKEIDGLHANIVRTKGTAAAFFRLEGESSDPLLFHRFFFAGGVVLDHVSSRVPVIEDVYVEFHHMREGMCVDGESFPRGADASSGLWYVYRNATPSVRKRVFAANCVQFCGGGASDSADALVNVELWAQILNNEHFPGPIFTFRESAAWIYGIKSEDAPVMFAFRKSDVDIYGASFLMFQPQPGPLVESIDSRYFLDLYLWHWQLCPPIVCRETIKDATTVRPKADFQELPGENAAHLTISSVQ